MEKKICHLTLWSFEYTPLPDEKKVEVVFLKKECNTAVILYNGEKRRIKQQYISGTLGQLESNQKVNVTEKYIEDYIYD